MARSHADLKIVSVESSGSLAESKVGSASSTIGLFRPPSLQKIAIERLIAQIGGIQHLNAYVMQQPTPTLSGEMLLGLQRACAPVLAEHLRTLVLQGEQKKAQEMLELNPELLLLSGTHDYDNCLFEDRTALQLALCIEDGEMYNMLAAYFAKLPAGKEIQLKQHHDQFPPEDEKQHEVARERDLRALKRIFEVLAMFVNNKSIIENLIKNFRAPFQAKRVIKTGKQFDNQLFALALTLYDEYYDRLGGWDSLKNNLVCCGILGFIESLFPTNYKQALSQGIYNITQNNAPLERQLKRSCSSENLSHGTYAIDCFGQKISARLGQIAACNMKTAFNKLCQTKTAALQSVMGHNYSQPHHMQRAMPA
jgi:hypothetical protein